MSQDTSPYFRRVETEAVFSPGGMMSADLVAGSHLHCAVSAFEPGQMHESGARGGTDLLFVVLSGRGTVRIGAESRALSTGELALAPAGTPHGLVADAGERLVVLTVTSPTTGPASMMEVEPSAAQATGGATPDAAVDGLIMAVGGDLITFQADPLTEPVRLVPASESVSRLPVGPARLVVEASARTFNRTMGTARAVQTRDGVPIRFTGVVVRIDAARKIIVVDVGYPVVAHDLGGFASESLAPGSGVMFHAEGPARATLPS